VKEAVNAAVEFVEGVYGPKSELGLALEEVEPSEDERFWLITLAFSTVGTSPMEMLTSTGGRRERKLIRVDASTGKDPKVRNALKGKHVVITGASSGIGKVTALKVAQAGGIPVLVARGKDKLEGTKAEIEMRGGQAHVFTCDLSDLEAIDDLCARLNDLPSVDYVVNNAGRSIRRSLALSHDRFHDFERTMQLNYFGAIRLIMGLMPKMKQQSFGHIVNISSIGVQTNPPRFSAYVAFIALWSVICCPALNDGAEFSCAAPLTGRSSSAQHATSPAPRAPAERFNSILPPVSSTALPALRARIPRETLLEPGRHVTQSILRK
jgi:hypothetical protein